MIPKFEKSFPLVCKGLSSQLQWYSYNTMHFDQYSCSLKIFWFLANNFKTKLKFKEKIPLVCRAPWDHSINI